MRGRKPKLDNVVPMRGDGNADEARSSAVERHVRRLQPKGLTKELRIEWRRVARLLADPTVDRLKPRFVDTIIEYCRVVVRMRKIREAFEKAARGAAQRVPGSEPDPLAAEIYRIEAGRNGTQVKAHPYVAQLNECWRQWRSLVAMLGLSPADERNMIPGQGDLFDESDRYLA